MTPTIFETYIERILREELEKRGYRKGVDFCCQFPLRFSFILDFAFHKQKIAIEADGLFWHSKPKDRKRDGYKNYILKREGWMVLRFSEHQINEDVSKCVDQIECVLKKMKQ